MLDLDEWRTLTLGIAALGQTAFVSLYLTFPWWRNFLGRALFGKAVMLTLVIDSFAVARLFHFGKSDLFFVILYSLLSIGVWAEVIAFMRVMFKENRNNWAQETDDQHDSREARDGDPS